MEQATPFTRAMTYELWKVCPDCFLNLLGDNGDGGHIPGNELSKNTIIHEKTVITIPNRIGVIMEEKLF